MHVKDDGFHCVVHVVSLTVLTPSLSRNLNSTHSDSTFSWRQTRQDPKLLNPELQPYDLHPLSRRPGAGQSLDRVSESSPQDGIAQAGSLELRTYSLECRDADHWDLCKLFQGTCVGPVC